jgi:hypothetical protein
MALFDDITGTLKGSNILPMLAIGLGASILAPIVIPIAASVAKPLAKAAIKGGLIFFEKGKEVMAEMQEVVEDLIAESKSELAESHQEVVQTAGIAKEGAVNAA